MLSLIICIFQCGSCSGNLINGMSTGKVLFHSVQPSNIHYQSFDPYELRVQEGPYKFNSIFFFGEERYQHIDIAKKGVEFSYFHRIVFDVMGSDAPETAKWTQEGIELQYPSGHRLFIPKKAFIGGR